MERFQFEIKVYVHEEVETEVETVVDDTSISGYYGSSFGYGEIIDENITSKISESISYGSWVCFCRGSRGLCVLS
jgi:hypothetical protein